MNFLDDLFLVSFFYKKKKKNTIKHAFSESSGNSGGDPGELGVLNSIIPGIGEFN